MKNQLKSNTLSKHFFNQLGLVTWHTRKKPNSNEMNHKIKMIEVSQKSENHGTNFIHHSSATKIDLNNKNTTLSELAKQISTCTRCALCQTRTQTVFGDGDPHAKLMLIGEAPGFYEDQQGMPFVGAAGQLLNKILNAIALDRSQVYIANILKCRPPENRDPHADEIEQCTSYLIQQIQIIQPKLIVALGRIAAHYLLQNKQPLESLRLSPIHSPILNTPIFVTYHPAYLLRKPEDKGKAWQDWKTIRDELKK